MKNPLAESEAAIGAHRLTNQEKQIVIIGVGEMVARETVNGGEGAKLAHMSAFRLLSGGGLHVCGDVSYQAAPDKPVASSPFYIELIEEDGSPVAKRGQVGFDKLKKAKVSFMCRHQNGKG